MKDICWQFRYGYIGEESLLFDAEDENYFSFSNFANSGDNAVVVNLYDPDAYDWLITPSFDLGDGSTNYMLEFDIALTIYESASQGSFEEDDYFAILVSTDGGNTWSDLNIIDAIDSDNDGIPAAGTQYLADLTGYTGVVKFAFYGESTTEGPSGYDIEIFIDNMAISELSGCIQPFGAAAYVVDATSVFVDWEDLFEGSNSYDFEYGITGFVQGTGTQIEDIALTEYLIEGLTYNTYDVYIQTNCGGSTSEWIMITFTLSQGGSCGTAFEYGAINDPVISSSIESLEEVWYYVLLDAEYDNVLFSLCDSDFDTRLAVFSDCETEIGENDDSNYGNCSMNNGSLLLYSSLPAGVYYVRVTGYDYDAYGDFILDIKSDVTIPTLMSSSDTFFESNDNDGTIVTEIIISLDIDEFTIVGSLFTVDDHYQHNALPSGLTLDVFVNSTTEVLLTISGTADSHTVFDNDNFWFVFLDFAFVGGDMDAILYNDFEFDIIYTDVSLVVDLTVIEPASGYGCGFTIAENVPFEIENVGSATIASGTILDFSMKSGGMVLFTESVTLTSDLIPTETFEGFTTNTVDLSTIGATYYKAYVDFAEDLNQDNDTLNGWVVNFEQTVSFPDDDDMNDTIIVGSYPYTIMPDVTYNPDSSALVANWQWVAGPMTANYEISADGWYYIELETLGCSSLDSIYIKLMTVSELAIEDLNLSIYPNPASENFIIEYSSSEPGDLSVTILSVEGKILESRNYNFNGELRETFDISSYASGMYIIRLSNNGKTVNKQLIKR